LGPWEVKGSEKVEASEVNGSSHVGGSVDNTALNVLELSNQSRELSPVPVELGVEGTTTGVVELVSLVGIPP